jgi:hypothetical protein
MTIQDALNKAVAGGYHVQGSDGGVTVYSGANSDFTLWTRTDNASSFMIPMEETLLDPTFWTAFGRALAREGGSQSGDWKQLWHQFTEHLIQGGTPAAFFQTLVSPSSPAPPQEREARSRGHQAETRATGTSRTHRGDCQPWRAMHAHVPRNE